MKNILIFIFITVSAIIYTEEFPGKINYDKFEKKTNYDGRANNSKPSNKFNTIKFGCNAVEDGEFKNFFLRVEYTASDWLFIEEGESLVLLLDDNIKLPLNGPGSGKYRDANGKSINEIAYYNVTSEELKLIANASKVEYKIIGSSYYTTGTFSHRNKINIANFYNYFYPNTISVEEIIENVNNKPEEVINIDPVEFNKKLTSTSAFGGGVVFVTLGSLGILGGITLSTIGGAMENSQAVSGGIALAVLTGPFLPFSAIFFGANYNSVKRKYLTSMQVAPKNNGFLVAYRIEF